MRANSDNIIGVYDNVVPDSPVLLCGQVRSIPVFSMREYSYRCSFNMKAYSILAGGKEKKLSGNILVSCINPSFKPIVGDIVAAEGELVPLGPENERITPGYRDHLKAKGVHAVLFSCGYDRMFRIKSQRSISHVIKNSISALRLYCKSIIDLYLPKRTAALLKAVIMGDRDDVGRGQKELFLKTGTNHILAVSGMHVSILMIIFFKLFRMLFVPRKAVYLTLALFLYFFIYFTGARVSTVRAAIMGIIFLCYLSTGSNGADVENALAISAFIILFSNPMQIVAPGFILSYLAVLSLIFIIPVIRGIFGVGSYLGRKGLVNGFILRVYGFFSGIFLASISVWVGVCPVIAIYFKVITPCSLLANVMAIPILFLMIFLGIVFLVSSCTGLLAPVLYVSARSLNYLISVFLKILGKISNMPFSCFQLPEYSLYFAFIYYFILGFFVVMYHIKTERA